LTNAGSFGPAETVPLSRVAKLLMGGTDAGVADRRQAPFLSAAWAFAGLSCFELLLVLALLGR
jgi:hypothetical protein